MNSLIGFYITCSIAVSLFIPQIDTFVEQTIEASCLVVDDTLDLVGSPEYSRKPILVDCSKDPQLIQLGETKWDPRLLFLGDQCYE